MRIIDKHNFLTIYCKAFTCIALLGTCIDIASRKSINYSQFNVLMIAIGCLIGVLIFSVSHYLEAFSPLFVMVIQYTAAVLCALLLTLLTSLWEPISPHGYRDMIVSFSVPYFIGAIIYNKNLKKQIKKQNNDLLLIKNSKKDHAKNM